MVAAVRLAAWRALRVGGRTSAGSAQPCQRSWAASASRAAATARQLHPPPAPGSNVADVETPALIVDMAAMEANLRRMADIMAAHPAVSIRPHAKTHKTVEIAALQQEQAQVNGVCCQKVSEALAMSEAVGDVLLSNEIVSPVKARRLAAMARRGCTVTAVVDSTHCVEVLAAAARMEGVRLGVLVDLNVGQDRCGVDKPWQAVELARSISELEELQFRGVQAYHGMVQHLRTQREREAASVAVVRKVEAAVAALAEAGFACDVVTGGGTGTFEHDAASGVFTEVQPGSYVFGDVDYARNLDENGVPVKDWQQSLFVIATVLSRNEAARRIVLDAGLKAVSYDSGPPVVHGWPEGAGRVESGGDEHTIVHVAEGHQLPNVGDQLRLVPGHCDPTVNLHEHLLSVRGDEVKVVWHIAARGPGM